MLDDVKRALSTMVFKDLSAFEPGRRGLACSDFRIHEEHGLVVRFVRGTTHSTRKRTLEKLSEAGISFSEGEDFWGV